MAIAAVPPNSRSPTVRSDPVEAEHVDALPDDPGEHPPLAGSAQPSGLAVTN
jgi:hypothetical protein